MRGLEGSLETDVQSEEITMSLDLTAAEDQKPFPFRCMQCFRGIFIYDHGKDNFEGISFFLHKEGDEVFRTGLMRLLIFYKNASRSDYLVEKKWI